MSLSVFYAWQSDTPGKGNHYLIRDALDDAIKALNADATVEEPIRLDHDTKGKTGTPPVAETNLEKIRDCGIFVADLTFIGKTRDRLVNGKRRRKRVPNPNVMLEVGYAFGLVPSDQIIFVMNTAFGGPKSLPFDLKHRRFPIQYDLPSLPGHSPDGQAIKQKRKELADIFKKAIGDIIASGVINRRAEDAAGAAEEQRKVRVKEIADERAAIEDDVDNGKFFDLKANRGVVAVSIFPETPSVIVPWEVERDERKLNAYMFPISVENGAGLEAYKGCIVSRFPYLYDPNLPPARVTCLTEFGEMFAAVNWFRRKDGGDKFDPEVQQTWVFGECTAETNKGIRRYLDALKEMKVVGPWHIGITILKVRNVRLSPRSDWHSDGGVSRYFSEDRVAARTVVIRPDQNISTFEAVAELLKPAWRDIWNASGLMKQPLFDIWGNYIGRDT